MHPHATTFRDSESILGDLCGQSADIESDLSWMRNQEATSQRKQLLLQSLIDLQVIITRQLYQYAHYLPPATRHKFHQYSRETTYNTHTDLTAAAKTTEGIISLVLGKNQAILDEIEYLSEKESLQEPELEFENLKQIFEQHLHDISRRGQTINDI
jgi:hypothetical protein